MASFLLIYVFIANPVAKFLISGVIGTAPNGPDMPEYSHITVWWSRNKSHATQDLTELSKAIESTELVPSCLQLFDD